MITNLDKIKDFKVVNYQIKSLNSELKDLKKDQLILHISNNQNSIKELINSQIFYPNNFKSYFVEKLIVSENKKIRKIINLNNKYKDIKDSITYPIICRNTIGSYKNANIFYDLSLNLEVNRLSSKASRLVKQREFFDTIFKKINQFNYKEKLIVINIDGIDFDNKDDYIWYFTNAISRKQQVILDYFKDITFLFISVSSKRYFKFTVDDDIFKKKTLINLRLEKLKTTNEIDDEEESTIENNGELDRFHKTLNLTDKDDEKEIKKTGIKEKIKNMGVNSDDASFNEEDSELKDKINNDIDDIVENVDDNLSEEELLKILSSKEEFKKSLIQLQNNQLDGHQKQNAEQLRKEQEKLSFMDVSLKDIEKSYEEKSINDELVNENIKDNIINKEVLHSTLRNYDKSYMEKKYTKDIANVLKSFNNDMDMGVFIKNIKLTNNNTEMNKQSLLEVEFKDDTNITHKFKVNIPEVKDGRFMYINGSKKIIMKQITFKPIVKLEPDRVQITTNYNKHFVTRFGQKFSEKLDYLKKIFTKHDLKAIKKSGGVLDFKFGNSLKDNGKYTTTAEYNDVSSYIYELSLGEKYYFNFSQQYLHDLFDSTKAAYNEKLALKATYDKKTYFCIGYTVDSLNHDLILCNILNKMVYIYDGKNYIPLDMTLSSLLINLINENTDTEKLNKLASTKIKTNTKLTYSRIEINNKKIPLAILLSYELGLLNLLQRYEIEYQFDSKNKSINLQDDIGKIKFKDGYLYFDSSKIRNTILLSGLLEMNCEEINFSDMNEREPYLDYFEDATNSRNAAKGFHNTITLLIDPITKDILEMMNLPTNCYDVLLYANTLLEDLSFTEPSDVNNYRIRGPEQIPAMLYKVYADAFKHYKDSKHAKNPIKITVDPDILIKKLQELKTIENYSSLNPSLELSCMGRASAKGISGLNVNRIFKFRFNKFHYKNL